MEPIQTNSNMTPMLEPQNPGGFSFKQNKWAIWVIVGSILIIAGLLSYFAFHKKTPDTQPKIEIGIDAPPKIASGSEIIYKVHFANHDSVSIKNISLDMLYPQGFVFSDSVPKPAKLSGTQYAIPTLDPSQDATIMIKGAMFGNADEVKSISAVMHYSFANLNSDFVANASAQSQIVNSSIVMQFDGPTKINIGQDVTYRLAYTNSTDKPIIHTTLNVTLPQAFTLASYNPSATSGSTFNLGTLNPAQSGEIKIEGKFTGANIGDQEAFKAGITAPDDSGSSHVVASAQYPVVISAVPLAADLSLTDPQNDNKGDVVKPGDTLHYALHYKNNLDTPVTGVIIAATLKGVAFDLSTIQAQNANIKDNTITWDAGSNSNLVTLAPNDQGDFDFSVALFNPATRASLKNLVITASALIKSNEYPAGYPGKDITAKVETNPEIDGTVVVNAGANPPAVGQNTTYLVVLSLRNTTNDITPATLTFTLPTAVGFNVSYVSASEPNVSYDQNTRKFTWNVNKLLAHTGDYNPIRKLQFNLTINPGQTSIGQPVTLVKGIQFTGTDAFTNDTVTATANDLSSSDDPSGDGTVH